MSEEMSMFRKVKDRITDEVDSATSKLQNIQFIDQLTSSVSSSLDNDSPPNQLLPEINSPSVSSGKVNQIHFSLIDDGPMIGNKEDEELNSDISPQHQLFNEQSIKPLHKSPPSSRNSENGRASTLDDHQSSSKPMLLAKFKESLKMKNAQIKVLKETLEKVDKFKEFSDNLRQELNELRLAHETWIVSIAENKRAMHQELEIKNAEIERLKNEINESQVRLADTCSKTRQLRTNIQELESRLVSTSAAHQKERESLKKELTVAKNNAIKQVQKEHELKVERIKLDLEKSIEALKMGLLTKDQQLMESAKRQQQLIESNQELRRDIDTCNDKLSCQLKEIDDLKQKHEQEMKTLKAELDNRSDEDDNHSTIHEQIKILTSKSAQVEVKNGDLERKLDEINTQHKNKCDNYENLCQRLNQEMEKLRLESQDLNLKLLSMTETNEELEKEVDLLKSEKDTLARDLKKLKEEMDELPKRGDPPQVDRTDDSSNQTEFEYLKNIVLQFMLGKEPIVLARVISAILKFDQQQVEQICKVQEAIHAFTRSG